jgi:hypothetical protein
MRVSFVEYTATNVRVGAEESILIGAFRPNENDHDGLSVFRTAIVTPEQLVSAAGQRPDSYVVARLRIADLQKLGLTVILDDAQQPGHCLIPEINLHSYLANKRHWRSVLVELSNLAAKDIVYGRVDQF